MSFGKNLKELRAQRELTQKELAKYAGIELAQVSRIETESSQPKLDTIKKLAVALKCSTDNLIFGKNEGVYSESLETALAQIDKLKPLPKTCLIKIITSYCEYELANERYSQYEDTMFDEILSEARDNEMAEQHQREQERIANEQKAVEVHGKV